MTTTAKTQPATNDIEWDVVQGENTDFTTQYPRLQWVHGNKQAAGFMKRGGLFISKEQYPNFTGEGFEPSTLITRDGSEIEGYAATKAKLAVIRIKHQWVKDETYGKNVPLAHVLCVVKGCPDLLCVSLKGASKSLDFQKAFNTHIGQNVAFANRTRPSGAAALEPFSLWFPLIAGEQISISSKDGKSSSAVTLPTLDAPAELTRDYVVSLWAGRENYTAFAGYFRETSAWQKQPIWEQRNDDNHTDSPAFTGGNNDADRGTPEQMDFIHGLVDTKALDAETIKEFCLNASGGETNQLGNLTKSEVSSFIEIARAY